MIHFHLTSKKKVMKFNNAKSSGECFIHSKYFDYIKTRAFLFEIVKNGASGYKFRIDGLSIDGTQPIAVENYRRIAEVFIPPPFHHKM